MSGGPESRRPRTRRIGSWAVIAAAAAALTVGATSAAGRPSPASNRVVAIADIHGDFDAFLGILTRVGLIDAERRWTGADTTLVQTGDYMDRGPKVRPLLDFLMAFESQASAGGGRAVILMGNHEASNALGNVRDVPMSAYAAFADAESEARRDAAFAAQAKFAENRRAALARADPSLQIPKIFLAPDKDAWMATHPPGFVEYLDAFGPLGTYGKWLRTRLVTVRVGDTVFVHGGINPEVSPKKLDSWNDQALKEIGQWDRLRKLMIDRQMALPSFTFEEILEAGGAELSRAAVEARQSDPAGASQVLLQHPLAQLQTVGKWSILDPNGPLWFRGYATWRPDDGAMRVDELQRRYGPVRFVVGHTMTAGFRAMPRFSARVFLIDTGMFSSFYQGGRASALEIQNGVYTVVTADGRQVLFDPMTATR